MDQYNMVRAELKKMPKRDLLKLAWQQKKGWCNVGARECGFLIRYKGLGFCLMELLGKGCSPHLVPEDETETEEATEGKSLLLCP
jgi:hypothetical protein